MTILEFTSINKKLEGGHLDSQLDSYPLTSRRVHTLVKSRFKADQCGCGKLEGNVGPPDIIPDGHTDLKSSVTDTISCKEE